MKGEKTKALWKDPEFRKKMTSRFANRIEKWDTDHMEFTAGYQNHPNWIQPPEDWATHNHAPYEHYLKGFTEESRYGIDVDNHVDKEKKSPTLEE